jgi:hypothetical protein
MTAIVLAPTQVQVDPFSRPAASACAWPPQDRFWPARKPAGGFALLTVEQVLLPWLAHQHGLIEPLALRAYFGLREMPARRCQTAPGTHAHYHASELQGLLGPAVRLSQVEAALEALTAAGLVTWTEHTVRLITHPEALQGIDSSAYAAMRAYVHAELDRVPVPRRMLRYLARQGSPGLIATTLGVVLRCLRYYARAKQCVSGGAVSAAWIATCLGLPERTAYNGLATLDALDWLATVPTPRWHQRQYGPWRVVNLAWDLPPAPPARRGRLPRPRRPRQLPLFPLTLLIGGACQGHEAAGGGPETVSRPPEDLEAPQDPSAGPLLLAVLGPGAAARAAMPSIEDRAPSVARVTIADDPEAGQPVDAGSKNLAVSSPTSPSNDVETHSVNLPKPLRELIKHQQPPAGAPTGVSTPQAQGATPPALTPEPGAIIATRDTTVPAARQGVLQADAVAGLGRQDSPPACPIGPVVLGDLCRVLAAQERREAAGTLAPAPAAHPALAQAPTRPAAPGPPTLRDVRLEDLRDVGRVLALGEQAQARGWITGSEADRLNVVAAAVHARRVGQEPCRLFVALLRDRRWEVITQEDEDTAWGGLRDYLYGPAPREQPAAATPASAVPLSDDARFVDLAQRVLRQAGGRGVPFLAVKLQYPEWTRQRWEHAQAELEQWRLQQAQANARSQLASLGGLLAVEEPWEDAGDAE